MTCSQCSELKSISNEGFITIFSKYPEIIRVVLEELNPQKLINNQSTSFTFEYFSLVQLELEMDAIQMIVDSKFELDVDLNVSHQNKENSSESFPQMLQFSEMYNRIKHPDFIHVIKNSYFTNHIQPILSLKSDEIVGYEFLLRPSHPEHTFSPYQLFSFAQNAGLQAMLDANARKQAIKYSSEHLPTGMLRFINFLPSSIYDPRHCLKSTFENIEKYHVDPSDLVFEVVETERIVDIPHLQSIFKAYKNEGIKVALDDIGAGYATIDVLKQLQPNYAKIDRDLISDCDSSLEKQDQLKRILEVSKEYNIQTLAEGVERKEELEFCRSIGFDLAQGYYIAKPNALPINDEVEATLK
ncbi:EAL domain-containing protein [Bacillus sp. DJP31]|uniref:EAL domain-containing protein n=1 Tax=Bacillus sp. DJP31 TaxID=3409789 RepID=UPI003BB4EC04